MELTAKTFWRSQSLLFLLCCLLPFRILAVPGPTQIRVELPESSVPIQRFDDLLNEIPTVIRLRSLDGPTRLNEIRKLAENGDTVGELLLGAAYEDGTDIPEDFSLALSWYRKAAKKGHPFAQHRLGSMIDDGRGVERSATEAVRWYELSAIQGYAPAQFTLALSKTIGSGTPTNHVEAVSLFKKAANGGHSGGMYQMGVAYLRGRGVEQNEDEATKWFLKAAVLNNPSAIGALALGYYSPKGAPANYGEAAKWAQRGLEYDDLNSIFVWAMLHRWGFSVRQDLRIAHQFSKKAAERGLVQAQGVVGLDFFEGSGTEKNLAEAIKWSELAAEKGDAGGQNTLGLCYDNGAGLPVDHEKANRLFRLAAAQGLPPAMNNLARQYRNGWIGEKNLEIAVDWNRKAAEAGDPAGQFTYATALLEGRGVSRDEEAASKWLRKSANAGYGSAHFYLGDMHERGIFGVEMDLRKAKEHYLKAAYQGVGADICYQFLSKHSELLDNDEEMVDFLNKAASRGWGNGYWILANLFKNGGYGLKRSVPDAIRMMQLAADAGVPPAQLAMADSLITPPMNDFEGAIQWWGKAAAQGSPAACLKLGEHYEARGGTNLILAYKWYTVGGKKIKAYQKSADSVRPKLTPGDLAIAESLIKEFSSKHPIK